MDWKGTPASRSPSHPDRLAWTKVKGYNKAERNIRGPNNSQRISHKQAATLRIQEIPQRKQGSRISLRKQRPSRDLEEGQRDMPASSEVQLHLDINSDCHLEHLRPQALSSKKSHLPTLVWCHSFSQSGRSGQVRWACAQQLSRSEIRITCFVCLRLGSRNAICLFVYVDKTIRWGNNGKTRLGCNSYEVHRCYVCKIAGSIGIRSSKTVDSLFDSTDEHHSSLQQSGQRSLSINRQECPSQDQHESSDQLLWGIILKRNFLAFKCSWSHLLYLPIAQKSLSFIDNLPINGWNHQFLQQYCRQLHSYCWKFR